MKLVLLVTMAYCLHLISCAPTTSIANSTNDETNDVNAATVTKNSEGINTFLLASMKQLLGQAQKPTVKLAQATAPQTPPATIYDKINSDIMKGLGGIQLQFLIAENIQLKKEIEALKEAKTSEPSGYALPGKPNQFVVPGENQIVIEIVDQQPSNIDTYAHPLLLNGAAAPTQTNSGVNAFRSYNFHRRH